MFKGQGGAWEIYCFDILKRQASNSQNWEFEGQENMDGSKRAGDSDKDDSIFISMKAAYIVYTAATSMGFFTLV